MEQIKAFRTSDGTVFVDAKKAAAHEAEIELRYVLERHSLHGNYAGSYVEWDDLLDWLDVNRELVEKVLTRND